MRAIDGKRNVSSSLGGLRAELRRMLEASQVHGNVQKPVAIVLNPHSDIGETTNLLASEPAEEHVAYGKLLLWVRLKETPGGTQEAEGRMGNLRMPQCRISQAWRLLVV